MKQINQDGLDELERTISVAPMMEWTDRHCRYFLRLITRRALLYTEMLTSSAVINGDRQRILEFDEAEHPIALQLGGSNPGELSKAARIGADFGYDEINLNVGCPSDRVKAGRFGACLMAEPALVGECVAAMRAAVSVPVTVKTRLGVDDHDSYEHLCGFVESVMTAGCRVVVLHARKAWLQGLSPKQNREIPPLRYDLVHAVKRDYSDLSVVLNGGLLSLDAVAAHLGDLDGAMLGRVAYHDPYVLAQVDRRFYGDTRCAPARDEVVHRLLPYIETHLSRGGRLQQIARHILGLYHGQFGGRRWRRQLSEHAHRDGAGVGVVLDALKAVRPRAAA